MLSVVQGLKFGLLHPRAVSLLPPPTPSLGDPFECKRPSWSRGWSLLGCRRPFLAVAGARKQEVAPASSHLGLHPPPGSVSIISACLAFDVGSHALCLSLASCKSAERQTPTSNDLLSQNLWRVM